MSIEHKNNKTQQTSKSDFQNETNIKQRFHFSVKTLNSMSLLKATTTTFTYVPGNTKLTTIGPPFINRTGRLVIKKTSPIRIEKTSSFLLTLVFVYVSGSAMNDKGSGWFYDVACGRMRFIITTI